MAMTKICLSYSHREAAVRPLYVKHRDLHTPWEAPGITLGRDDQYLPLSEIPECGSLLSHL